MENRKFKPLIDKLYWLITLPTLIFVLALTVVTAIFHPPVLFLMIPILLFISYFLISTLFGYVELRENTLFIKYGFFLKKEIEYSKIRSTVKDRKIYSESMMALKNALEHVNIKYNIYDVTTVSVIDNDRFIKELNERIKSKSFR